MAGPQTERPRSPAGHGRALGRPRTRAQRAPGRCPGRGHGDDTQLAVADGDHKSAERGASTAGRGKKGGRPRVFEAGCAECGVTEGQNSTTWTCSSVAEGDRRGRAAARAPRARGKKGGSSRRTEGSPRVRCYRRSSLGRNGGDEFRPRSSVGVGGDEEEREVPGKLQLDSVFREEEEGESMMMACSTELEEVSDGCGRDGGVRGVRGALAVLRHQATSARAAGTGRERESRRTRETPPTSSGRHRTATIRWGGGGQQKHLGLGFRPSGSSGWGVRVRGGEHCVGGAHHKAGAAATRGGAGERQRHGASASAAQ